MSRFCSLSALREALHASKQSSRAVTEIFGLLPLIVWTLAIIVTVKYVGLLLKADNQGLLADTFLNLAET